MTEKKDRWTSGYMRLGDVLFMNWGMAVNWPECPRFLNEHYSPYALGCYDHVVQIGVPIKRKPSIDFLRNEMAEQIKGLCRYRHVPLDDNILERFIRHQMPDLKVDTFVIPVGLYQIVHMEPSSKSFRVDLRTYAPGKGRPIFDVYITQGSYNPTHIDVPQIVTNPEEALEAGWG